MPSSQSTKNFSSLKEKMRILATVMSFLMGLSKGTQENCPRVLEFIYAMEGRTLVGHVFQRTEITSPDICEINCFVEADCVSFNVGPLQDGKYWCELSNSDHIGHPEDLVYGVGNIYRPVLNLCSSNPCPVNSRCQTGFTDKGYRCVCTVGFTGKNCNEVIPVRVTTSPKIISAQKDQHVTFTCSASGSPNPVITWSKSQGSLPASRSFISEGKLTILDARIYDIGSYVCNATNTVGTNSSSVELKVFCSLVHIIKPVSTISLYVGQALKLSCPTSSGSELWMYNETTSLPQDALIETPNILLIPSINKDHVGNYSCVSGNSLQRNVSLHVKYPETCSTVKQNTCDVSAGDYIIDPDDEQGEAPFTVYCDMNDKGGVGVTVVSHDSEDRTHVTGFEGAGSYQRDIHYNGASLNQIKGLAEVSKNCQQFIKYECKDSKMKIAKASKEAWWVSRDGVDMNYWGGATLGCACGMTSSCDNPLKLCNCDKNDPVWREDSGLLTNKSHLPVSQLRFGDTGGSSEQGYHTLGKLECYGMN